MQLVEALASGIRGAESGSATLRLRGTSTPAPYYDSFEADSPPVTTGTVALDQNGGAVIYVGAVVDVIVFDLNGSPVRSFTVGSSAKLTEVISPSFTGTDYVTAANAVNKPVDLGTVLDRWVDSAGAPDWQVEFNGAATDIDVVLGSLTGYLFNVKSPAYGAKGDGTTNDAAAIAAAIADASVAGGEVFFPPGRYKAGSGFSVPEGVSLIGCGRTVSVIVFSASGVNGVTFTDNNKGPSVMQDLGLDASVAFSGQLVHQNASTELQMRSCALGVSGNASGAAVIGLADATAILTVLDSIVLAGGVNTLLVSGGTIYAARVQFRGNNATWAPTLGAITPAGDCKFVGCNLLADVGATVYFLYLDDSVTHSKSYVFVGNSFSAASAAVASAAYRLNALNGSLLAGYGNRYDLVTDRFSLVTGVSDYANAKGRIDDPDVFGEYEAHPSQSYQVLIPAFCAEPPGSSSWKYNGPSWSTPSDGSQLDWIVKLPVGTVLTDVVAQLNCGNASAMTATLFKMVPGAAADVATSIAGPTNTPASIGRHPLTLTPAAPVTVTDSKMYFLVVIAASSVAVNADGCDHVYADVKDGGPRGAGR